MSPRWEIGPDTHVLVLTGAGVSAESGIPTFRGSGGLWENHRFERLASPGGFEEDPDLSWRFYSWRRSVGENCQPNPGHLALAKLEERLGNRFLLITQNVDGLHRQAGSRRMVEMHGNIFKTRCFSCARPPFEDHKVYERAPRCEECGDYLRPHIVWFGEVIDPAYYLTLEDFFRRAGKKPTIFLAAGTSGSVHPAAGLVAIARSAHASTWLVNAEEADNVHAFDHFIRGKSGEVLPILLETTP